MIEQSVVGYFKPLNINPKDPQMGGVPGCCCLNGINNREYT